MLCKGILGQLLLHVFCFHSSLIKYISALVFAVRAFQGILKLCALICLFVLFLQLFYFFNDLLNSKASISHLKWSLVSMCHFALWMNQY